MSAAGNRPVPKWPGDPFALTAEAVDFVGIGHVLANTCCWGGRSLTFLSLAQRALTVCKGLEQFGGLGEEDSQKLALHALLGEAWRAWLPAAPPERDKGGSGKASEKHARERGAIQCAVLEAAGLSGGLPDHWVRALEMTRLQAEAAIRRDLAGAGIGTGAQDGGLLFPPLKARIRPLRPNRAAAQWLERFEALRAAVLRTAERRAAEPRAPAPGGEA